MQMLKSESIGQHLRTSVGNQRCNRVGEWLSSLECNGHFDINLISSECGNHQRVEKIIKGLKRNRCGRAPDRSTARSFFEGSRTCADFQAHPFDALEMKRSTVGACPRSSVCLSVSPLKQFLSVDQMGAILTRLPGALHPARVNTRRSNRC
jgi:hypothetical protein